MLCEIDDLLAPTSLKDPEPLDISFVLHTNSDKRLLPLHMSKDVPSDDWQSHVDEHIPVSQAVEIPELNVKWILQSWPSTGWMQHSQSFIFSVSLCVCFSIMSCCSVYSMLLRESLIIQMRTSLPP
eukprot:TRINITY_DN84504_c0_g1_i1.p1 TRINITY_DN84504_c0_g1~~TRINITY_DN84504_c0_g1_i1.p1  ORF type:complete len:138 (-),score=15.72 TRINITY_DN84504_c0_g1_i1:93-470(-)